MVNIKVQNEKKNNKNEYKFNSKNKNKVEC